MFVPFKLIYPDADIPIVQLSLKIGLNPALHIAAGRAIAPLRDENVLIVGSGMSYHNMAAFMRGEPTCPIRDFRCLADARGNRSGRQGAQRTAHPLGRRPVRPRRTSARRAPDPTDGRRGRGRERYRPPRLRRPRHGRDCFSLSVRRIATQGASAGPAAPRLRLLLRSIQKVLR